MNIQEKTKEILADIAQIDKEYMEMHTIYVNKIAMSNYEHFGAADYLNTLRKRKEYLRAFLDGLHYAERIV